MKALLTAVVPVCCIWLLSGCGPQQTKEDQKEATAAAIKTLERVKAATQVGVTFLRYGEAVIDAKSAVNEAERVLPDGDLRFYLSRAMRAYQDANTAWAWKIEARSGLSDKFHKEIIDHYRLRSTVAEAGNLSCDAAMQVMWVEASEALAAAREVVQKPNQDSQLSRLEAERERNYKAAEAEREREKAERERLDREAKEKAAREEAEAKAKREREAAEAEAKREREAAEAEARREQAEAKAKREKEQAEAEAQTRREREQAEQRRREERAEIERQRREERARQERRKKEQEAEQARIEAEKARLRGLHLSYAKGLLDTPSYHEDSAAKKRKGKDKLEWIVKEYPGSDEAKEAAKLLEKIKKDGGP
jgi:hypothetical protein